jgi:hypothetical protein
VARWWHPLLGERLRVEHSTTPIAGCGRRYSMLGCLELHAVPYFWSTSTSEPAVRGHARGDEVVLRGSVEWSAWSAFYRRDGRLQAALTVNRSTRPDRRRCDRLWRAFVSAEQLYDVDCDLKTVASQAQPDDRSPLGSALFA